jgi:hypothetical protein
MSKSLLMLVVIEFYTVEDRYPVKIGKSRRREMRDK